MITTNSKRGRVGLMAGHCAGMVDLVALPIWVGALVAHYRFDPQQAGLLASLFLIGAVLASLVVAPRFNRLSGRLVAVFGFGVAAAGFAFASTTTEFGPLAVVHGLCGMAAGAALSVTHGTVARSGHPHRLFALLGIALGIFAIVFMAATPGIVAKAGGPALFKVLAGVMLIGAVAAALAFPMPDGVTLVQAMTFSFLERVANDRGFSPQSIHGVLVALGLVALVPPVLAALPAMVMIGAAIGPFLGGTLVKAFGYGAIGVAALAIAVIAVVAFSRLPRGTPTVLPVGVTA